MSDLKERIAGGLLGVATGDALGGSLEFMDPSEIRMTHGVHREIIGGGYFDWRPGQGTDDTDLTWAVLSAYLDGPYTLERAADNMLEWFYSGPNDIGGTTWNALMQYEQDKDPRNCGETGEYSNGNGSLMRCISTALARSDAEIRRSELKEISAVTHAHRRSTDSCLAYGEIVNAILEGADTTAAIAAARDLDLRPLVQEALEVDPSQPVESLSTSGYVIDSLRCAVWAIQQNDTFEEILVALVNRGGDADTTGAIAGGLLGVSHGVQAIPSRWLEKLEYRQRLQDAVPSLVALRELGA